MATSSNGNPYGQFLGLPETITQPDHYQLLGIERFTSDPKLIQDAAITQNKKLALWQNNDQLYSLVRQLQLEVANAQMVLTDPAKRQAYDQALTPPRSESETVEETFQQQTQEFPPRPPSRGRVPQSQPLARPPAESPTHDQPSEEESAEQTWGILWAVWGVAGVAVLILIGLIVFRSHPPPESRVANTESFVGEQAAEAHTDESRVADTDSSLGEEAGKSRTDESRVADTDSSQDEEAGETRNDNGLKMRLVWCPPGNFTMGSPKSEKDRRTDEDQVPVTLSNGFWLGQTEITQGQWDAVMGTTPWKDHPVKEGSNYPATYLSWEDAIAFCEKLTEQERKAGRLPEDWEYTLPTEAQWEYACRAGTTTAYSFGDEDSQLGDYGWFYDDALDVDERHTHEVGTKKPNPWGLSDMHGNVQEWCRDRYASSLPGGRDPEVTGEGSSRVQRGGSWYLPAGFCRSAIRFGGSSSARSFSLGFRVARVLSSSVHQPQDASLAAKSTGENQNEESKTPLVPNPMQKSLSDLVGQKAGETRSDNGLKMTLVWCPPGNFTMGSPKSEKDRDDDEDQVQVTLSNGFWLGRTEVTQGQWESVMGTTPWKDKSDVKDGSNYVATYVSWVNATAFCKKLTELERKAGRLPEDWEYMQPTDAQWEYACRAGTTTAYSFGDDDSQLGEYAWFRDNAKGIGEEYAHTVGIKKPNPWGLSDMHGNVWEWCRDRYAAKLPGGRDPEVTAEGSNRWVFRGGSWFYSAGDCRSAYRSGSDPSFRNSNLGFRVARVLSSSVHQPQDASLIAKRMVGNQNEESKTPLTLKPVQKSPSPLVGQKAGETRNDNGLKMTLVWCPTGNFIMGSPISEKGYRKQEVQVQVTLTNGFWLGQTEVTQGQWQSVMGTTPWKGKRYAKEGSNFPATYVSWENAVAFCEKLTEQERKAGRLPEDWEYTLPTEAQWEYACRAGTTTAYSFGDEDSQLGDYAWFSNNASRIGEKYRYAHEVGTKKPNPWGLSDMHGNVYEWCRDWYADKLPGGRDPEVTAQASFRVLRGGYWGGIGGFCRSACRSGYVPSNRRGYDGFRVAAVQVR